MAGQTDDRRSEKFTSTFSLDALQRKLIFFHLFDKNVSYKSWFLSNITHTLFIVSSTDSYNLSCETLYRSSAANPESVYSRKRRYCVLLYVISHVVFGGPMFHCICLFHLTILCNDFSAGLRTVHL